MRKAQYYLSPVPNYQVQDKIPFSFIEGKCLFYNLYHSCRCSHDFCKSVLTFIVDFVAVILEI